MQPRRPPSVPSQAQPALRHDAYNRIMTPRGLPAKLLTALWVGVLVYLGVQIARTFLRYSALEHLQRTIFSAPAYPPTAATIGAEIAEVRRAHALYGGVELELLLSELLLHDAELRPDQAVKPLSEAIKVQQDAFRQVEPAQEQIALELAWAYYYAGLPGQLERWQATALASAPSMRLHLRFLLLAGRIERDDVAGAEKVVKEELAEHPQQPEAELFALAWHMLRGDTEAASTHAQSAAAAAPTADPDMRRFYAVYLLNEDDPAGAEAHFQALLNADPHEPERAFDLSLARAARYGLDAPQTASLLAQAASSSRNPCSLPGIKARAAGTLFQYTREWRWADQLMDIADGAPADFDVQAAAAEASLTAAMWRLPPQLNAAGSGASATLPMHHRRELPGIEPAVAAAQESAKTTAQLQEAWLLAAQAAAYRAADNLGTENSLKDAAAYLERALRAGETPAGLPAARLPDYDGFVLDPVVRMLRATHPGFDAQVHKIVIDYLNRRRELFSGVDCGPPLTYGNEEDR